MRIVFFGTSAFAVPSLTKLALVHTIPAVITRPDTPQGRCLAMRPSAVKVKALRLGLEVRSIEEMLSTDLPCILRSYNADLFVVVAYGRILPRGILSIPVFYSIGLHASFLPRYRGACPINQALLAADEYTGVTVFKLAEKMDAGDIIMQEKIAILESDNALTLSEKLSEAGADLLLKAIGLIERGQESFIKQNDSCATFTSRLKKEDGIIEWRKSAFEIHNKVRGFYGWPGAFSALKGRKIKIWATEVTGIDAQRQGKPGEILGAAPDGLRVLCGLGILRIKELQEEGGRRLTAAEYLRGHKVKEGDFFL